jgi:hypothetical protein
MTSPSTSGQPDFQTAFRGRFSNLLSWDSLDTLWQAVRAQAGAGWYIYAIGMPAPTQPASADDVIRFIDAVDALLRHDHREEYCGIVYVDNTEAPTLVKIFDPHNLGTSCGSSKNAPLPGWILSRLPPEPLTDKRPLPAARQRWWRTLWNADANG